MTYNQQEKYKNKVISPEDQETEIAAYGPLPSKAQLDYHKEELAAFIHYGMNTYTDSEWGDGQENPEYFNPTNLDTDQWIKTLKDAGFKRTIMVFYNHDCSFGCERKGREKEKEKEKENT